MLDESQITYALSVFRMFVISVRIWLSYCLLIQNGILNVLLHLQLVNNDKCSDTSLPRIFIWKENTKYEELINESYIVKCKISTHTMIKMNVLRMMALYMDHVICLLSLKEAGAFLTVKHRYTPNKSMSTSTEKENKMFNKKRSLIHGKK